MQVALVVATDRRGVIGKDGGLPWHLPADLAHFKRLTLGHPVVMGRATYDSIGRPLPGRRNLVLSRDLTVHRAGCRMVRSVAEAIAAAEEDGPQELMVIGGAQVYAAFLPRADRILRTVVETVVEGGDTFFPDFDEEDFELVAESRREPDERNPHALRFQELRRRARHAGPGSR